MSYTRQASYTTYPDPTNNITHTTAGTSFSLSQNSEEGTGKKGDRTYVRSRVIRMNPTLPIEVWEIIMGNLTDGEDLFNTSQACSMFDEILTKKKSTWMFEKVLPHIFKDLRKADLMTLRLVCKTWSQVVDHYVDSHPSLQPFHEQTFRTIQSSFNYLPLSAKVYDDIAFVSGEQCVDFMETMNGHPRNPFFGRSIRIGSCGDIFDCIDDAIDNTWEGAAQLCEQFGAHLWHMEFANYEFALSALDFYKGINRSLVNLPNLRTLHMNGALDPCEEDDIQLFGYMAANPLPDLPFLESLVFDLVMETEPVEEELLERQNRGRDLPQDPEGLVEYLQQHPEAIQQLLSKVPPTPDEFQDKFITTYASQLKKLEIDMPAWRPAYGTLLINLREVHLKHVNSVSALTSLLHNLQAANLGKLVISLRCSMRISQLFHLLRPLRILFLDFGYLGEAPDDYLVESLRETPALPVIDSLVLLRIKDTIHMTYGFLQKLPSLQHLDIWECQNARRQFCQEMDKSNTTPATSCTQAEVPSITTELRKLIYLAEGHDIGNISGRNINGPAHIWNLLLTLKIITYRTRSGLPSVIRRYARDGSFWEYTCTY